MGRRQGGAPLTIPVTFTVWDAVSSGSYTVWTNTYTMLYDVSGTGYCINANGGPGRSCQVQVTGNTAAVSAYSACVASGPLLVNNGSSISNAAVATPPSISVDTSALSAGNATYSGYVVVYNPNNPSDQVAISVTIIVTGFGVLPLAPVSVSPAYGAGQSQAMTFTFTDPKSWQDLDVVNILINSAIDGRNACYLAYSQPSKVLYLVNDAGTALLPGMTLSGTNAVANTQCLITAAGSSVAQSGITLTLTLNIAFGSGFSGNKIVYLAARDLEQNDSSEEIVG